MNFNKNNKWDFSEQPKLINGEIMENIFSNIITNKELKFEIKSENQYKWLKTGNIYIEFEQYINGKWTPSGISVTEAEYWVHILKDFDNQFMLPIMVPTEYLKKRIKWLLSHDLCSINSKDRTEDGTATKGFLMPLKWIYITDDEIDQYEITQRKHIYNKIKQNESNT